jgi:hypothetical protein
VYVSSYWLGWNCSLVYVGQYLAGMVVRCVVEDFGRKIVSQCMFGVIGKGGIVR